MAIEIDYDEPLEAKEFIDAIWSAIVQLYGEYGASKTGLALIDYDAQRRFAVLRSMHTAVVMVRTALATITKINNKPTAIHVITISGTIKALTKKMTKQPS